MNAVEEFMRQIEEQETRKLVLHQEGQPALKRLIWIAKGDTGQSMTVRRFLLGLYNGHAFPFDMTHFRGLDQELFEDCMRVLKMDARATVKEIHQYVDDGKALFLGWAEDMQKITNQSL